MGVFLILFLAIVFILSIIRYKKRLIIHLNEKITMQSTFQQAFLQTRLEIQEETFKTISQEIR